jgi:hypothetical protein
MYFSCRSGVVLEQIQSELCQNITWIFSYPRQRISGLLAWESAGLGESLITVFAEPDQKASKRTPSAIDAQRKLDRLLPEKAYYTRVTRFLYPRKAARRISARH